MDSVLAWCFVTLLVIGAGIWFALYASAEYDKYLYKRQHGWH